MGGWGGGGVGGNQVCLPNFEQLAFLFKRYFKFSILTRE